MSTVLTSPILAGLAPGARRAVLIAFWGNLACQVLIILSGGVVRLTGSGLGCSTWPNCEPGQFTPRYSPAMGIHPFIEFGNRTLTGVLSVFAVLVLAVVLLWLRDKGRSFLLLAIAPLVGTAIQAGIGGITVLVGLSPGIVLVHFLVSALLVAVSALLLVRLHDGDGTARLAVPRPLATLSVALAVVAAAVLVLGTVVTGSGPHSGDADKPVRLGLDPRMVSWLHADAVMLFCGLLIGILLALHLVRTTRRARAAAWTLVAVTAVQAAIGYTQYFTGLPGAAVALHMLGAALFTAAVTWLVAAQWTWQSDPTPAPALSHEAAAVSRRDS